MDETNSTKVYYHLDDNNGAPYMSQLPISLEKLTLGDFKRVFKRRGYTYYCKQFDKDLKKEVKVEISSEAQRLYKSPINGLVELYLLSTHTSPLEPPPSTVTLPRKMLHPAADSAQMSKSLLLNGGKRRRRGSHSDIMAPLAAGNDSTLGRDWLGGQRVSMATNATLASSTTNAGAGGERSASGEASSDINTLISKRAGEQMADVYASEASAPPKIPTASKPPPMDDYPTLGSDNTSLLSPDATLRLGESSTGPIRRRKPRGGGGGVGKSRHHRQRKPYVPSTISSGASASMESSFSLPRVEEHRVDLKTHHKLGISVACQDGGIFISRIEEGSAAEKSGGLEVGDQIVQVEHTSFEQLSDKQAVDFLRKAAQNRRPITVYVAKRPRHHSDRSSVSALSLLCETTAQLDLSQWVEQSRRVEPLRPFIFNDPQEAPKASDPAERQHDDPRVAETSDEERAAYDDRRNGVGQRLVPALKKKLAASTAQKPMLPTQPPPQPQQQRSPVESEREQGSPSSHPALDIGMDPSVILKRMCRRDSGLEIKDRRWLKIPVPMSFIGDEMLAWLMANVSGFQSRKAAKAYAGILLSSGLIRHIVQMGSFNEKCYYVFDDSIIADRLREDAELAARRRQASANGNATMSSGMESNTEITYMTSAGGGGGGQSAGHAAAERIKIVNNQRYHSGPLLKPNTAEASAAKGPVPLIKTGGANGNASMQWPISPIVPSAPLSGAQSNNCHMEVGTERVCCESPTANTNDYASMVMGGGNSLSPTAVGSAGAVLSSTATTNAHIDDPKQSSAATSTMKLRDIRNGNGNGISCYGRATLTTTPHPHHQYRLPPIPPPRSAMPKQPPPPPPPPPYSNPPAAPPLRP